jgi:acetylornithine/succinyldiaminopimelate/putrescine aminotransferase
MACAGRPWCLALRRWRGVRLLPPLIIEEHHIRECVDKLSAAARAYQPAEAA